MTAGDRSPGVRSSAAGDRAGRLQRGQFATDPYVANLVVALTLRPGDGRLLDPALGGGVFLRSAAAWFGSQGLPVPELTGVESSPDVLATAEVPGRARRIGGDFLAAWDDPSGKEGGAGAPAGPPFDAVIGNPPYVRHERASLPPDFARTLRGSWGDDAPRLPRRADLSLAFLLRAGALLAPGGRVGFVTTNGWLDVAYLRPLQRFLLGPLRITAIVGSACERWFADAAVNTAIVVAERRPAPLPQQDDHVVFAHLHRPLAELVGDPNDPGYWTRLRGLAHRILGGDQDGTAADPTLSLRRIAAGELLGPQEGSPGAVPALRARWGFQLRAPTSIREVLSDHASELVPLGRTRHARGGRGGGRGIATLRYGVKPGILAFFAPKRTESRMDSFGVEPEFRRPLLYATRSWKRTVVGPEDADRELFVVRKDLPGLHGTGAGRYIAWGATQRTPAGIRYPDVPSVRLRKPGWHVQPLPPAGTILLPQFRDARHLCPFNPGRLPAGNTAFVAGCREGEGEEEGEGEGKEGKGEAGDPGILAAVLNTSLTALLLECLGRVNLGGGLLTIYGPDFADLPVAPPALLRARDVADEIVQRFRAICRRAILPIPEELRQPDRHRFEESVLEGGLGLRRATVSAIRDDLAAAVQRRRGMARSRSQSRSPSRSLRPGRGSRVTV